LFFAIIAVEMIGDRERLRACAEYKKVMQQMPASDDADREYQEGYDRVMSFAAYARARGWRLSDRQLVHEILQRERAAMIREKSSLPLLGGNLHSAAFNRGQADALREILREQRKS
jgi:hypothetical protein